MEYDARCPGSSGHWFGKTLLRGFGLANGPLIAPRTGSRTVGKVSYLCRERIGWHRDTL